MTRLYLLSIILSLGMIACAASLTPQQREAERRLNLSPYEFEMLMRKEHPLLYQASLENAARYSKPRRDVSRKFPHYFCDGKYSNLAECRGNQK